MNHKEIETLKAALMQLLMRSCWLKSNALGIDGKVVGIGFKPLWTSPDDSKIDKIEFNILDRFGRIRPLFFNYIIGYNVAAFDGERFETAQNVTLELHLFAPGKVGEEKPYDRVRLEIGSKER